MKINTDGVLLGVLAQGNEPQSILDIGTGTGVIALMLAQRFISARIDAVEIDEKAAQAAEANFKHSTFADRLKAYSASFEQYFEDNPNQKFDLIITNPPFYINSLQSPGAGKKLAKHADDGFFNTLVNLVSIHLSANGQFWLILPIDTAELVKKQATANKLFLQQIINIKSYPESEPHREILSFGLTQTKVKVAEFVIYDALKQYSGQYQMALKDFFTIF